MVGESSWGGPVGTATFDLQPVQGRLEVLKTDALRWLVCLETGLTSTAMPTIAGTRQAP